MLYDKLYEKLLIITMHQWLKQVSETCVVNFFLHLGLYHQKANYLRFVLALNWCRSHKVIPLVGCRSKSQATDTLASLDWQLKQEERDLLDSLALTRCTLDSPLWRRKLFVALAGVVMTSCRLLDILGFGVVKQASIGMSAHVQMTRYDSFYINSYVISERLSI